MRRSLRALAAAALLLAGLPHAAQAAIEMVRTSAIDKFTVKLLRAPNGFLIDLSTPVDPHGEYLRYFAGDQDITPQIESAPPSVEFVYSFAGVSLHDQCLFKATLDTLLAGAGAPFAGYAGGADDACSELDVQPAAKIGTDYAAWDTYSRLLLIEIAANDAKGPVFPVARIADRLILPPSALADQVAVATRLREFLGANANGGLSFVPAAVIAKGVSVQGRLFRGDTLLGTFDVSGRSFAERLADQWLWVVAALLVLTASGATVLLVFRRGWGTPVRVIVVGYGERVDYSLGPGPERLVARLKRFKNGVLEIERLADGDPITVNGAALDGRRRIRQGDHVVVAGKSLKLV